LGADELDDQFTVHVEKDRRAIAIRDDPASGRIRPDGVAAAHETLRGDLKQRRLPSHGHAQRERVHERGLRLGRRGEDRRERRQNEARGADGNEKS